MYRYSPRVERIQQQAQFVRGERAANQQGTAGRLDLAKSRNHARDGRAAGVQLVVHLKATDFLDFQKQVVQEHRVAVQVNERAGEVTGHTAVHLLEELPVQLGRQHTRRVFLQADDGAGRPQLVLGIEIPALVQRDVLPRLLTDLAEDLPACRSSRRIWSGDSIRSRTLCVCPRSKAAMSEGPMSVPWLTGYRPAERRTSAAMNAMYFSNHAWCGSRRRFASSSQLKVRSTPRILAGKIRSVAPSMPSSHGTACEGEAPRRMSSLMTSPSRSSRSWSSRNASGSTISGVSTSRSCQAALAENSCKGNQLLIEKPTSGRFTGARSQNAR